MSDEARAQIDDLDVANRGGVTAIYFVPDVEPRPGAAVVVEYVGGPKRYAYYWIGPYDPAAILPDFKWVLPDDAITLWMEKQ